LPQKTENPIKGGESKIQGGSRYERKKKRLRFPCREVYTSAEEGKNPPNSVQGRFQKYENTERKRIKRQKKTILSKEKKGAETTDTKETRKGKALHGQKNRGEGVCEDESKLRAVGGGGETSNLAGKVRQLEKTVKLQSTAFPPKGRASKAKRGGS